MGQNDKSPLYILTSTSLDKAVRQVFLNRLLSPAERAENISIADRSEISVRENGNRIHQKIVDKIFKPFFTTKPTGQGTGLGLSLAYDIVKAHGGELKAETKEGEFAEFVIAIPVDIITTSKSN